MSFAELGLSDKVLQAVTTSGYTEPTPIQAQAIPHVLARRDVLGIAQTGTGKTAAFVLPMLTLLETGRARARMPRTLILEPTRELAAQVEESFERYGVNHRLSVALLIGGVSFGDQDAKITRGVDVLIATPGRLLDHFERGKLLLSGRRAPRHRRGGPHARHGLHPRHRADREARALHPPDAVLLRHHAAGDPAARRRLPSQSGAGRGAARRVDGRDDHAAPRRDGPGAAREARHPARADPRARRTFRNAIIFCNRKRDVAVLHRSLETHGFNAAALHGDMDQRARMAALEGFRNGETTVLVASDVAARGLDIPAVSHVFNYDVPHHAEDYVHRIGRTGRAGRAGASFTLVAPGDERSLAAIEKLITQSRSSGRAPTLAERPASEGRPPPRARRDSGHAGRKAAAARRATRERARPRGRARSADERASAPRAARPARERRRRERQRARAPARARERPRRGATREERLERSRSGPSGSAPAARSPHGRAANGRRRSSASGTTSRPSFCARAAKRSK